MADRALLHRNKLDAFREWLIADGWTIDKISPKEVFKVLQARKEGRRSPLMVYDRLRGKHLSLLDRDRGVVWAFIQDSHDRPRATKG